MKNLNALIVFTVCMIIYGCGSNNTDTNTNNDSNQVDTVILAADCFSDPNTVRYPFQKTYTDTLQYSYGLYYIDEDTSVNWDGFNLVFKDIGTPEEQVALESSDYSFTEITDNTPSGLYYELYDLSIIANSGGANTSYQKSKDKVGDDMSQDVLEDMVFIVVGDDDKKKKGKIIVRISTSKKLIK